MDLLTNRFRTLRLCLTNDCSLSCFYCSSEGHRGQYSIFNKNNAVGLITACYSCLGIKRVKYTGGEPFLFGDLTDTVKAVRDHYSSDISQSIVTNGTFPEKLKKLIDSHDFLEVTLSVPCLDKDTFTKLNRVANTEKFSKIMESLDILCAKKIFFKINYVLIHGLNDTNKHIEFILKIAQQNQNCSLRFLEPVTNRVNTLKDRYLVDSDKFLNMLKDSFGFVLSSQKRSHLILNGSGFDVKYIRFFCDPNCNVCPDDKTSIWITPEGVIRQCCYGNMNNLRENKITEWDLSSIVKSVKNFAKNNK